MDQLVLVLLTFSGQLWYSWAGIVVLFRTIVGNLLGSVTSPILGIDTNFVEPTCESLVAMADNDIVSL